MKSVKTLSQRPGSLLRVGETQPRNTRNNVKGPQKSIHSFRKYFTPILYQEPEYSGWKAPFLSSPSLQPSEGHGGKSYHLVRWLEGSLGNKRAHSRGCWPRAQGRFPRGDNRRAPRAQRRFPRGDNKRAGSAGTQNSCPMEEEGWRFSGWREYRTRWPGSHRGKRHPWVLGILCDVNRCQWPSHIIVIVPLKIFSLIKAHDAPFFPKYLLGILQQFHLLSQQCLQVFAFEKYLLFF